MLITMNEQNLQQPQYSGDERRKDPADIRQKALQAANYNAQFLRQDKTTYEDITLENLRDIKRPENPLVEEVAEIKNYFNKLETDFKEYYNNLNAKLLEQEKSNQKLNDQLAALKTELINNFNSDLEKLGNRLTSYVDDRLPNTKVDDDKTNKIKEYVKTEMQEFATDYAKVIGFTIKQICEKNHLYPPDFNEIKD